MNKLLLILFFYLPFVVNPQEISFNLINPTMEVLIAEVESQTEFKFAYGEDVDIKTKLSGSYIFKEQDLQEVLKELSERTPYTLSIVGNNIAIGVDPPMEKPEPEIKSKAQLNVEGTVTDPEGMPIPGVNVIEKGTSNGTVTNFDGEFTIDVPPDAVLEFSYLGYTTIEVGVDGETEINISMESSTSALEEVVVVGYGTQTKKDLTGSVSTLDGDEISERSVTNVSNALQGAIPGVSVTRGGSLPGSSSSVQIRGVTTLEGSSDPLILVDDVAVESLDDVNPNQIESISVLKDAASAAIYGSRAAAGVIIVTTKRAKAGVFTVNYSGEGIMNTPTELRSTVGPIRYMEMANEQAWNDNENNENEFPVYSEEFINNYLANNAENPDQYPITDYADLILKDYSLGYRHNLTLSGGSEKVKTIGAFGYEKQNALYDYRVWKRYTARINNDIKFNEKIGAILDISFNITDIEAPSVDPTNKAILSAPIYPALWSDGRIAGGKQGEDIYAQLHHGGFVEDKEYELFGRIGFYYKPIEGLKLSLNISPRFDFSRYKSFNKTIPYWAADDPQMLQAPNYIDGHSKLQTSLYESRGFYNTLTTQALANYNTSFGDHNIEALLGFEEYSSSNETLGVEGREFVSTEYPYLSQAPIDKVFNSGTGLSELAYSSYFGRIVYDYKGKYLAQANIRRDASSRFGAAYRWGTFPSASLGWVVSEEEFFQSWDSSISFLKLRASYGELGNDRLGNYLYLSVLQFSNALFPNGSTVVAERTAAQLSLAIEDITWETTKSRNLGMDVAMFDDRLYFTGEYYIKDTENMLLNLSIPDFSGYEDPRYNVGSMKTKGWEFVASWRNNIGDLFYSASFNIYDSKSIIGDIGGKRIISGTTISAEGTLFNAWYGYKSDGLYQTQEEIDNSATMNSSIRPGDVKYIDISGPNGEPDGLINELDRTLLGGSPLPRYQYGGNIELDYQGFDFGLTFQGVGKQRTYLTPNYVRPFQNFWLSPPSLLVGNYWSVYNTSAENENVRFPRLSKTSISNNYAFSDFWLIDGSYFRIKNITLGYTIPASTAKKVGLSNLRIYVAGNDLFSIDDFPEGIDPEYSGGYLITKSYLLGINVKL